MFKLTLFFKIIMFVAITKLIRKSDTISSEVILMALSSKLKFVSIGVYE